MGKQDAVAASFASAGDATAAIDWFRNQAIEPDAIAVWAVPPGGRPRAPGPGDNARDELSWIVSLDLRKAKIARNLAIDAMRREGGTILRREPAGLD